MRDFFFHIFARKRSALGVRSEFSGYRSAQSESEVLADLYNKYEHITVLEIRERKPWLTETEGLSLQQEAKLYRHLLKKRVTETTVYQFDELSEKAKEKAREWYRQGNCDDTFWSECTVDEAKDIGKLLGMDIDNIYFSGFWSKGDGACFEGTWRADDVKLDKLKEDAPQDEELHRIGEQLGELAVKYPDGYFRVKHRGHYSHSGCTSFDVELPNDQENELEYDSPEYKALQVELGKDEDSLIELARDYMNWIYRRLEADWEWQNADAQVDENIRANEYEFLESGERA